MRMKLQVTCNYRSAVFQGSGKVRSSMDLSEDSKPLTPDTRPAPVRIAIRDLLAGGREAVLLHDGAEYRLRLTSNGKLILTK